MTDRTTKVLLAVIALGLWVNLGRSLFWPVAAIAPSHELSSIERDISRIKRDVSSVESNVSNVESNVSSIDSEVDDIKRNVSSIEDGTCTNSKIC